MEIEKLLINDKIWAPSPTNMSPKHVTFDLKIKRNKLQKWALTNHYANKFSKKEPTQFQSASIFFKFCPSVSPFVFAVLFILSINALRSYFYVSFTLVAVTTVWIIINFVTQPFSKLQKFFFCHNAERTKKSSPNFRPQMTCLSWLWKHPGPRRHDQDHRVTLTLETVAKMKTKLDFFSIQVCTAMIGSVLSNHQDTYFKRTLTVAAANRHRHTETSPVEILT